MGYAISNRRVVITSRFLSEFVNVISFYSPRMNRNNKKKLIQQQQHIQLKMT